jgi:hypothetical protein
MNCTVFVAIANHVQSNRYDEITVFSSEERAREHCRSEILDHLSEAEDYEPDDEDDDEAASAEKPDLASLSDTELRVLAEDDDFYCEYHPSCII